VSIPTSDLGAAIGTGVIDNNNFQFAVRLPKATFDRLCQESRAVVTRDDDGNQTRQSLARGSLVFHDQRISKPRATSSPNSLLDLTRHIDFRVCARPGGQGANMLGFVHISVGHADKSDGSVANHTSTILFRATATKYDGSSRAQRDHRRTATGFTQ
jgi:hypothetical protein